MYKIENDLLSFLCLKGLFIKNPKISGLNHKQRILINAPTILRFTTKSKGYYVDTALQAISFTIVKKLLVVSNIIRLVKK
jgi:hypothetical protein